MPGALARLLRLRLLLEESSRMELERRAALSARIDRAQGFEKQAIHASREHALKKICEDGPAVDQALQRTTDWSNAESAAWRRQQLQPLAAATARSVAEGREEFLERHKERRQVESVLDAERARLQVEQERRAQRDLDDWFGIKQIRERRKDEGKRPSSEKTLN
jgi:hypothetical protein